jgi:hypothetical protein
MSAGEFGSALLATTHAFPSLFLLYTDPGSGTLLWQLLLAVFFGGMFYVRRLKEFLVRRKK